MDGDAINNFDPTSKHQNSKNKVQMICPINPLKLKKIRYRWCGIRGSYLIQIHWNTKKIGTDGVVSESVIPLRHKE